MADMNNLYKVAVIGDPLLTRGMALAGVKRIYRAAKRRRPR